LHNYGKWWTCDTKNYFLIKFVYKNIYTDLFIILPLLRIKYKVIEGTVYWCIGPS
jgi:hypothetical protein